jgi:hypothetical protein
VVWCGVVWCGVVWCGVVWCGEVRWENHHHHHHHHLYTSSSGQPVGCKSRLLKQHLNTQATITHAGPANHEQCLSVSAPSPLASQIRAQRSTVQCSGYPHCEHELADWSIRQLQRDGHMCACPHFVVCIAPIHSSIHPSIHPCILTEPRAAAQLWLAAAAGGVGGSRGRFR